MADQREKFEVVKKSLDSEIEAQKKLNIIFLKKLQELGSKQLMTDDKIRKSSCYTILENQASKLVDVIEQQRL